MRTIDMLVIHETDTVDATVESIRRYHMQTLGWHDIGYHYVIYRDGSVHKGRANSQIGAHCQGDNATSIGVCLVGKGSATPPQGGYLLPAQWTTLLSLCQRLCQAYQVPVSRVVGHRERPSGKRQGKTCPGFKVQALRDALV